MKARDRRGVALMLALWMIIVLGALAAAVAAATRTESAVARNLRARARARAAAESGVAYAAAELRRAAVDTRAPQDLAFLFARLRTRLDAAGVVTLGAARFQVAVIDLNARIDLNAADEATLRGLFAQFTSADRADAIVAALEDWKDPDDERRPGGAEAADYAAAAAPFRPANGPLQSVDELMRIRNVTPAVAASVAPWVTVWSDAAIDVNMAPEPVLAALPGVGAALARALVAHRATAGLFRSFGEATAFLSSGGTSGVGLVGVRTMTVPTHILIVSRGWEEGHPLSHEVQAAVELRGLGPGRPPQLVLRAWHERDR